MRLVIEWSTPEECINQIAQIFYLMATSNRDSLNDELVRLDQTTEIAVTAAATVDYPPLTKAISEMDAPPAQAPAPAIPVATVPVAASPAYTLDQLSVAAVGVIDKIGVANGGREALSGMLQQQFGVQAMTELKPEQYDTFALALRQMGGDI